ncbi:MAG: hypothetical protein HY002_19540 [Candidatus Rokubacteria bacterium]|nr:hypothetical protein [Candidatus Rokubacteria bacterium]
MDGLDSAIVYVERKVLAGRIAISQQRSAIYHHPAARYPLARGTFDVLRQFRREIGEAEPASQEDWIWL